jgi:hypothetical protein
VGLRFGFEKLKGNNPSSSIESGRLLESKKCFQPEFIIFPPKLSIRPIVVLGKAATGMKEASPHEH